MSTTILARDIGFEHINGALVRKERKKKEPKPLKRSRFSYRQPKEKKPSDPFKLAVRRADTAFSKAIRTRDCGPGYGKCITCGALKSFAQMDNGHYLGREYWATRWDPMNCAAQCRKCNRFKEGLKAEFRAALVRKYGEERISKMEQLHKIGRKPSLLALNLLIEEIRVGKKTEAPDAL